MSSSDRTPDTASRWLDATHSRLLDEYDGRRSAERSADHPGRPLFLKRAIGIIRVSEVGDRKGESFVSPRDQVGAIQRSCAREEMRLLDVFEELDISAFKLPLHKRPGLSRAVGMIERGEVDVVVVAYFDRLFRNMAVQREVCERVERAGGRLLAVDMGEIRTDTAARWLSSTMLGMVSEFHARLTREKTQDAKSAAIANGIPTFATIPPGYLRGSDRRLLVDDTKAELVHEAFERRAAGDSLSEVFRWAQSVGLTRSWRATQDLLRNRIYLGELRFGKLVNTSSHPPLVDAGLFRTVQHLRVVRGPRADQSVRLLAHQGIVLCGSCNGRMVIGGQNRMRRGQMTRYQDYRCNPIGTCTARAAISADLLDKTVIDSVKKINEQGHGSLDERVIEAQALVTASEQTLNHAVTAFDGMGDVAATRTKLLELKTAHTSAKERLEALRAALGPVTRVTPVGEWDRMTLHEQRSLIRATIKCVVVRRGVRGVERITIEPFEQ